MQTLERNLTKYLEIVLHRLGQLFSKPLSYIIANQAETNKTFLYYNKVHKIIKIHEISKILSVVTLLKLMLFQYFKN